MLGEVCCVQTAIARILNMRGNGDTNLASPKRTNADKARGV